MADYPLMAMPTAGTSTAECFQPHQQDANGGGGHHQRTAEPAQTQQQISQKPAQHSHTGNGLAQAIFPSWLDQQNAPAAPFGFGMPELPLTTASSMAAAFDYSCGNGMGLLPPGYPAPPAAAPHEGQQQQQQQDPSQLFMGGLYDSLAAAAALAGAPGNFWAGADFYGGAGHWQHWQGGGCYPQAICPDQTTAAYFGQGFEIYTAEGLAAAGYGQLRNAAAGQQPQTDWQQQTTTTAVLASAGGQSTGRSGGTKRNGGGGGQKGSSHPHHLTVPETKGGGQSPRRSSSAASTAKALLPSGPSSPNATDHYNGAQNLEMLSGGTALNSAAVQRQRAQLSPLLAQLPAAQPLSRAAVRDYLANPARFECALWIFHAKVAQKSYGNEKRFFCPPPCVYLLGDGWRARRKALDQMFRQLKEQQEVAKRNCTAKEPLLFAGEAGRELFSELAATLGIGPAQGQAQTADRLAAHQLDFSNGKDYCAAKALFISDSDKRKYFHLQAQLGFAGGALPLGLFPSQRIKVISKPSKKKQSMKSSDCKYLCVGNGSKIALFNRLRSQTVSTRYLHVENGCFHASSTKWGAFHIHPADDLLGNQPSTAGGGGGPASSLAPGAIITYGSTVQLVDSQSNIALPRLRIRKVDKQMVLLDPAGQGEPVSQLHKCAFQMVDPSGAMAGQEMLYLCLSHDKIIQHQAIRIDAHRHQISDGAAWTIISTDKSEYRWAEPMAGGGGVARLPVTPMPQVQTLNLLDQNGQKLPPNLPDSRNPMPTTLELNGVNFSSSHQVWFGATPAETLFCAPERLSCAVPPLYTVCADLGFSADAALANAAGNGKLDVPILVIRQEDGILYPTALTFTYSLHSLMQTALQMPNQMQPEIGQAEKFDANPSAHLKITNNGVANSSNNNNNRFHPYANGNSTGQ